MVPRVIPQIRLGFWIWETSENEICKQRLDFTCSKDSTGNNFCYLCVYFRVNLFDNSECFYGVILVFSVVGDFHIEAMLGGGIVLVHLLYKTLFDFFLSYPLPDLTRPPSSCLNKTLISMLKWSRIVKICRLIQLIWYTLTSDLRWLDTPNYFFIF